MIQISHPELAKLVQKHHDELSKKITNDFPSNCKYSVKEVLTAVPDKLMEIAKWFQNQSQLEQSKYEYIKTIGYGNFSKKKQEYNAYDLAKSLNINSCPYCNRNYTFTVTKNGETLRPDIDHFYDKDTFPILALSFYNLIPSCIECNRTIKRTKNFSIETHIHPYKDSLNNYAKFKLQLENSNFYFDKTAFVLKFNSNNLKAQKNIDDLKLEEIYNEGYKNIILELIQKAEIYNESYIDELFQNYEGTLFKNREDLLRLITCGYITDEEIHKRPLSKLIKDISEELEITTNS